MTLYMNLFSKSRRFINHKVFLLTNLHKPRKKRISRSGGEAGAEIAVLCSIGRMDARSYSRQKGWMPARRARDTMRMAHHGSLGGCCTYAPATGPPAGLTS